MKIKIAFMYLDVSNLGDTVIYETARYIVEDILQKHDITDYEIVPVDIGSFKGKKFDEYSQLNRIVAGVFRRVGKNRIIRVCPPLSRTILKKA
ncbi:MAG: hypothetical protein Q4E73_10845, partial [Lachnospiraceae bacterium]|nr:hypothetical protein [Lachnospiraceae bacterium]